MALASPRRCKRVQRAAPVNDREHGRHEKQRGDGRKNQAADDGASQRRILLAAIAQPERHRDHADDHGQGRHEHRAQPRESGLQRGLEGIIAGIHALARKADHQYAVRGGHAHAHDGAGECGYAHRGVGQEQHPDDARPARRAAR